MNEINEKITAYIRIKMNGRSIREVSKEVGIAFITFSRILNGKTPSLESFIKIVNWLKVDPRPFFDMSYEDQDMLESARYDLITQLLGYAPI